MYIKRDAESILIELSKSYPVVSITGPRQSGKTTLVRKVFKNKQYVSLEDLDQRRYASKDPRAFLSSYGDGLIIDEVQNCPKLFSYIQGIVDESNKTSQFILTGSKQFGILSGITQSLAGRVGNLELLPLSIFEMKGKLNKLEDVLHRGFYPPLHSKKIRTSLWYRDYIKTYLERDVRELVNIKNLSIFQKFLSLCAARNGTIINLSELSNATGIDVRTVKQWLSVLEASYIIFFLKPYYKNFSKRVVKSPKLYFYDSGLLCSLLKITTNDLVLSPYKGSIFESVVIGEILKYNMNHRMDLDLFFWRSNKGVEIDLLFEKGQKIYPIEIKSGKTIQPSFFKNILTYKEYIGKAYGRSFVIYGGDRNQNRTEFEVKAWKKTSEVLR